jgi:HAD superfamily hydrolase (TIGR01484 family)
MSYYRALAVDYDGTLTEGRRPDETVLDALRAARASGLKVVLVTGRITSSLRDDFPDVDEHFDVIVAENGAVLARAREEERALAEPISPELSRALQAKGISFQRGRVLLSLSVEHAAAAELEIQRLGLEYHLSRNRAALMILPAAASKGGGLCAALSELGISPHSTLAVGDAENDHSLIDVCELGVAVGNAVDALKEHADVVLREADGTGIPAFLDGPILSGAVRVHPRRWNVPLGAFDNGEPATVPGSQANVLVTGDSGSGKSYVAGLLAERLISLGYTVCVLDPEGEHDALGQLRGAAAVGGDEPVPRPDQLRRLVLHRLGSLVVDLSSLSAEPKLAYLVEACQALGRERAATGLPHWIVIDEAQLALEGAAKRLDIAAGGFCVVTYQPERVPRHLLEQIDVLVALRDEPGRVGAVLASLGPAFDARFPDRPTTVAVGPSRRALMATRQGGPARVFTPASRVSAHVRHWRKYMHAKLPPHRWFLFRGQWGVTGRSAANVAELHDELQRAGLDVVEHHVVSGDFSRWIATVVKDDRLALAFAAVERDATAAGERRTRGNVEEWRTGLLQAIEDRYP